jgi:hypothetical protein
MKRFDSEHVEKAARNFSASHLAKSWHLFGRDIQSAIIDAFVMQELRWAHVADSTQPLTATEIIEFRDALAERLADPRGVKIAGRRDARARFEVSE